MVIFLMYGESRCCAGTSFESLVASV